MNGLAIRNARRSVFNRPKLRRRNGPLPVDRTPQGVDDAADHRFADRHLHDAARTLHRVALLDLVFTAEDNGADIVLLQIEDHAVYIIAEIEQLASHSLLQAVDMGDAVTDFDNSTNIIDLEVNIIMPDLIFDDSCYFFRIHLHNLAVTPISLLGKHSVCPKPVAMLPPEHEQGVAFSPVQFARSSACNACMRPIRLPSMRVSPMRTTTPPIIAGSR